MSYSDYRRFREYGHGPWTACVLSISASRWFAAAAIAGALLGLFLGSR